MRIKIHLTFNGQCREAFEFYRDVMDGSDFTAFTYGESPGAIQASEQWQDKIVHASLKIKGLELAGADIADNLPTDYEKPQGFYLLLEIEEKNEAVELFEALAKNGSIQMPIQETFWSPAFGVLVDQFGIPWEISCLAEAGHP